MDYRKYFFGTEKSLALTYCVRIVAQSEGDKPLVQELNIRAASPDEAVTIAGMVRNEKFIQFDTVIYINDHHGLDCLVRTIQPAGRAQKPVQTDSNAYHVTVIREAGADPLTSIISEYAQEQFSVHALTRQEAYQMAVFMSRLPFKGQHRRTLIEEKEHFDERY